MPSGGQIMHKIELFFLLPIVPFCQSEGSIGFYKFPSDVAKNATWVKYCGLTRDSTIDDRVCYLHFKTESFSNNFSSKTKQQRLRSSAIPELNVPNVPVPLLDDHDQEEEDYEMSEEQVRFLDDLATYFIESLAISWLRQSQGNYMRGY